MRKQQHLLAALAVAALGVVVTPAEAASQAPPGTAAGKPVKQAVQKRAKKTARKAPAKRTAPAAGGKKAAPRLTAKPAAGAAALASASPSTDVYTRISRPGDYRFSIRHQGGTRTYRVHVPAGLGDEPAPLVVALHGATVDQPANDGLYGLGQASDRHGFVAVFPDAARAAGGTGAWNATGAPGGADDVGFIETVVANVFRQLNISRLQIYAAGMSDGGSMAYRLACERPHLFRAVASVGGADTTLKCAPEKAVSVLHMHAKNDSRVLLAGLPGSGAGAGGAAATAADSAAKWARLNGCMEAPRPVLEKAGASCQAWSYCREQAQVQLCVTESGGHSWPGALKTRGGEAPSQALSATDAIWAFFSSR